MSIFEQLEIIRKDRGAAAVALIDPDTKIPLNSTGSYLLM